MAERFVVTARNSINILRIPIHIQRADDTNTPPQAESRIAKDKPSDTLLKSYVEPEWRAHTRNVVANRNAGISLSVRWLFMGEYYLGFPSAARRRKEGKGKQRVMATLYLTAERKMPMFWQPRHRIQAEDLNEAIRKVKDMFPKSKGWTHGKVRKLKNNKTAHINISALKTIAPAPEPSAASHVFGWFVLGKRKSRRYKPTRLGSAKILEVAHEMYGQSFQPVTPVALFHELRRRGHLKQRDFDAYLMSGKLRSILQQAWGLSHHVFGWDKYGET